MWICIQNSSRVRGISHCSGMPVPKAPWSAAACCRLGIATERGVTQHLVLALRVLLTRILTRRGATAWQPSALVQVPRRRQAAALQGASRIFIVSGCASGMSDCLENTQSETPLQRLRDRNDSIGRVITQTRGERRAGSSQTLPVGEGNRPAAQRNPCEKKSARWV